MVKMKIITLFDFLFDTFGAYIVVTYINYLSFVSNYTLSGHYNITV